MKFSTPQTLESIASLIKCEFVGPSDYSLKGLNEIHVVEEGDIVFVDHPKYYQKALSSAASCVLIDRRVECPAGKVLLISEQPFADFNKLIANFTPFVSSSQSIAPEATIGEGTILQPGVVVAPDVVIGKNCIIHPNTVIYGGTRIGDNVIVHANCTLGSDAFYYNRKPEGHKKFLSCGQLTIENDVEIGAGSTIDRGVTGTTRIGEGTKIDNQMMIGHDVTIGKRCIFAAQGAIAGTVIVEDDVRVWGQVGIAQGSIIRKGAEVLAMSGVMSELEGGKSYWGVPVDETRDRMRQVIGLRKLPDLLKKLRS